MNRLQNLNSQFSPLSLTSTKTPPPVILIVTIEVDPERLLDFQKAIKIEALGSRLEEGCYRFDVLIDPKDPCKFTIYEAYRNESDIAAHRKTAHFKIFQDFKASGGLVSLKVQKLIGQDFTF